MGHLGNTPRDTTVLSLEVRKSFALGLQFVDDDKLPLDLTGCQVRFVAAKPKHLGGQVVIDLDAEILDAALGTCQFELQASHMNLAVFEHPFSVVLQTALGYSTVVVKGVLDLRENTDLEVGNVYDGINPATNLAVHVETGGTITVQVSHVDGLATVVNARILEFTTEAIALRDQSAASAAAAATAATTASASATSSAASASIAQTVAAGATDSVVAGILNDTGSSSRATLNAVVEAEVAANPVDDSVVAGLVGDTGSATYAEVNTIAGTAVDSIDHDAEMTAVLSNPASDAKMLLELEYGYASSIVVTPDGGLAATDVQAALEELDAEKAPAAHSHAYVQSVRVGSGLTRDNTDPLNPVLAATAAIAVACRARPTTNTPLPNDTATVVPLDAETHDTSAMHSTSSNQSRIVAPVAGYYRAIAGGTFSATTGRCSVYLWKNGVQYSYVDGVATAAGACLRLSDELYLAAGEYVELAVQQRSGGAAQLYADAAATFLSLSRIGD